MPGTGGHSGGGGHWGGGVAGVRSGAPRWSGGWGGYGGWGSGRSWRGWTAPYVADWYIPPTTYVTEQQIVVPRRQGNDMMTENQKLAVGLGAGLGGAALVAIIIAVAVLASRRQ